MNCTIFGAGKIARGFIGHLLYLSDIKFTFVEKFDGLVDLINERGQYFVNILGNAEDSCTVTGAKALKFTDEEAIAKQIAASDAVFTAVGGKNLGDIAPLIAMGIKEKAKVGGRLNVVTCENWKLPANILRDLIVPTLNEEEKAYFDENSPLYKMLITNPRNLQKYTSASIDENAMTVSEYCRYSDTMFSVNVKLTQKIIRTTGTLKTYQADKTYFFTKIGNDYRVTAYTNEHVTETVEQVRLSFVTESGTTGQMICTDDAIVTPPAATAPQGQELVGWATKTMEEGTITMTVRILPDGTVLGGLEPMELYPVFQPIDHP